MAGAFPMPAATALSAGTPSGSSALGARVECGGALRGLARTYLPGMFAALGLLLSSGCASLPRPEVRARPGEVVLLLHGFLRGPGSMQRLHRYLEDAGFIVEDWSYPSSHAGVEDHARKLRATLHEVASDPAVRRIHIVGHSLGGLVARAALADRRFDGDPASAEIANKVGRLVTLATPHRGSPRASAVAAWVGSRVPILTELTNDAESPVHSMGLPTRVQVGTVSGARDRTVAIESSRMTGEHDHLLVDSGHSFIMNHPDTLLGVLRFLTNGSFGDLADDVEKPLFPANADQ